MSVTRREFLAAGAAVALAIPRSPQSPGGSEARNSLSGSGVAGSRVGGSAPSSPVVSFHLDRPYVDLTGLEKPYLPPAGLRAGAPLAALSEEEVLSRFYGFI